MRKSRFFTGQPIFNQVLNFIPRQEVRKIARSFRSDHYCKSFDTYSHLVTMLYAMVNRCTSLREVTTGLLAWEGRISHLGLSSHPRRSTLADANKRRSAAVFEAIYLALVQRYRSFLPDSRIRYKGRVRGDFYIMDSTTISLFGAILKAAGRPTLDGKRKGGIKVHTLLHADSDVPVMALFSAGAANDMSYLEEVKLPKGSVVVFDAGYRHHAQYNRLTKDKIVWVTLHRDNSVYVIDQQCPVNEYQQSQGVIADWHITLGHNRTKKSILVKARMVTYIDPHTQEIFYFITNDRQLAPLTIANYYQKRWQIEIFFKRIKQNFPLSYFLGDNENAIKIQIWCALIADLLIRVIKKTTQSRMAFSNMIGLVRLHLMTYMDLRKFLRHPEKSLIAKWKQKQRTQSQPSLFDP